MADRPSEEEIQRRVREMLNPDSGSVVRGGPQRLLDIPLWKPRWSQPKLSERRKLNERAYRRGFELVAYSAEELTFPDFEHCRQSGVTVGGLRCDGWLGVCGVDLSSSKRKGNVIVTVKIHPQTRRRYLVDCRRGAWRGHQMAEQLAAVNSQWKPHVIGVEDNGVQELVIDLIRAAGKDDGDFWAKIEPCTTTSNKRSEEMGHPALQVEFSNRAWVIPWGEYETHQLSCECDWCALDREFRFHPTAEQEDGVMGTWFARRMIDEVLGLSDYDEDPDEFVGLNVR